MPFGDLSKRRLPHPVFQLRIFLSPWTDLWKHLQYKDGEGNGNPLQYSCLGNPMGRGAWKATQSMGSQNSQTRLRDSTTINPTQTIYKNQEWLGLYLKFRNKEFEQAKVHHTSSILIWQWLDDKVWRRQWHPTLVLLPGESHGQRSLVGCSPWGR